MKSPARVILLACLAMPAMAANPHDLEKLSKLQETAQTLKLDLSNVDLRKYPFSPGKIDLQAANLSHSNLSGVDLSKMNLGGADLSYADLSHAKLNQVNLINANLSHTNLSGAEIKQSDLSHANLTCANLDQANLTKSVFADATISGASFVNTITAEIIGYDSVNDGDVRCTG